MLWHLSVSLLKIVKCAAAKIQQHGGSEQNGKYTKLGRVGPLMQLALCGLPTSSLSLLQHEDPGS